MNEQTKINETLFRIVFIFNESDQKIMMLNNENNFSFSSHNQKFALTLQHD